MDNDGAQFRCVVTNGGGTVTSNAAVLTVHKVASIPLSSGWNMIAFNIHPADSSVEAVFGTVEGLVLVKNNNGQVYWPEYEINTIGDLRTGEGYKVYMSSDDTLRTSGTIIDIASTAIDLDEGWAMIAYLPQEATAVKDALSGIEPEMTLVKSSAGEIYWPEYSINTIGSMKPGQGYKIHMKAGASLVYP